MKLRESTCLRLGRIGYLNTFPFYHKLDSSLGEDGLELDWSVGSPMQMNQKIYQREIDIAPISSLEYLNHQDQYLLLPNLCIGARDFSSSVLLLSKERIERLNGALISLSEESLSAATLLRILLKFKFRFENEFRIEAQDPVRMLAHSKACLLIGDKALFCRPEEFVYKTDLSEVWWQWTGGQPFCFSVWAVRKDYYEGHEEAVKAFYRRLKTNLDKNLQDLEKLIREGLQITFTDEKFPTAFGYFFSLNYGLDAGMRQGLELFFRYAHELGVSPAPQAFQFITD